MLVSIFDGFLVDLVVILSTAKPSELSSRLGAVPLRAILAYQFFHRFFNGFVVDVGPMLGPKILVKSIPKPRSVFDPLPMRSQHPLDTQNRALAYTPLHFSTSARVPTNLQN